MNQETFDRLQLHVLPLLQEAYQDGMIANLRGADLREANLREADLCGADLDFSCWALWCGSVGVKVDLRIAAQLAGHFCSLDCDDEQYRAAREALLPLARQSHQVNHFNLESRDGK